MDQIRIIIWIDRLTINTYDRHTRVPFRPRIRDWKGRPPNLFCVPFLYPAQMETPPGPTRLRWRFLHLSTNSCTLGLRHAFLVNLPTMTTNNQGVNMQDNVSQRCARRSMRDAHTVFLLFDGFFDSRTVTNPASAETPHIHRKHVRILRILTLFAITPWIEVNILDKTANPNAPPS